MDDRARVRQPLRVILDSNIIVQAQNPRLDSVLFNQAFAEARAGRFQLVIPSLVIQEAARVLAEQATEGLTGLRKATGVLRRLGLRVGTPDAPNADRRSLRDRFERELTTRFREAGATIADYPQTSHQDLVARLL